MADEQQPVQSQQPGQGQPAQEPGPVPYERFKEVNDQFKALKSEWDKAQAAQKAAKDKELAEQQKWQKLYEEREAELKNERTANLKMKVALSKGLPSELIDRLRGDDEESLGKDADALLALIKPAAAESPKGPGIPPSRGSQPARLDLSKMTPEEIRKNRATLWSQQQ